MTFVFKSAISALRNDQFTDVYEVPAGKTATIISAVVSTRSNISSGDSYTAEIDRAGVKARINDILSVSNSTTASTLPAKMVLQAGDKFTAKSKLGSGLEHSQTTAPFSSGVIYNMLASATAVVAVCANGIYRSTDDGGTWEQVSTITSSAVKPAVVIGASMFVYTSATTALRSTDDGVTWTSGVAITNGPAVIDIATTSSIVKNGSAYYGAASTTQIISTTDGVTWANFGVATPAAITSIAHSGTHVVCGQSGGTNVYRSTDGASWATVAAGVTTGNSVSGLASNGSGTLIAPSSASAVPMVSTDHGATWSAATGAAAAANYKTVWTGSAFLLSVTNSNTDGPCSPSGLGGSWTTRYVNSAAGGLACISSSRAFFWLSTGGSASFARSSDLSITPNTHMSLTLSVVENG